MLWLFNVKFHRYRTLIDRLLGLQLVPAQRLTKREVSYEFMNRQMVWHAFTVRLLGLPLFLQALLNQYGTGIPSVPSAPHQHTSYPATIVLISVSRDPSFSAPRSRAYTRRRVCVSRRRVGETYTPGQVLVSSSRPMRHLR